MAPKYGSNESFAQQKAILDAIGAKLVEIEGKEIAVDKAMQDLGTAEDRAAAKREQGNAARREAADLSRRAADAARQEATALDVDTAAIERNRIARERHNAVVKQQSIDVTRAARGAQDPLLNEAYGVQQSGGGVRQYRQQLGVGYSRARALEDALGAGFRPGSPGATVPTASTALVQSDIDIARAKKDYSSAVRRGALAEAELAKEALTEAQQRKVATQASIAAMEQRAQADLQVAREEVAQAAGVPGSGLIRHPTLFGTGQAARIDVPQFRREQEVIGPGSALIRHPTLYGNDPSARLDVPQFRRPPDQFPRTAATAADATPRTPREQWMGGLTATQVKAVTDAENAAIAAKSKLNALNSQSIGLFQREAAAAGTTSQAMFRHGALTQEYIIATARGETTLRELGNQALITAGKFGGWTAAATAVFGLAAGFHQVYTGAKDAQSAVAGLQRFIPNLDQAKAGVDLENLSRKNNVPVAEAGTAQQGFARVYGNEADAYVAADTALKAFQLDQISVQDSTKYLTALTQEFGIKANELPGVFDQISRSQRVSNARVAEMLPLLARSAAAVKTAGGDLTQLIALGATAQVASGQSGNTVGTAFTRSASNFSRNPANLAVIRAFGVDTTHGFTEMLVSAVREASHLSGSQRNDLAKAIGGPQYGGRIFTTLLNQDSRLERNLTQLTPEASKGSTEEEFKHRMEQADQRIKQVGVSLQNIGAALVRSGAFGFAGLLLETLNGALRVTNRLIDLYDKVPDPFRSIITSALELTVIMRGLQRFGALRGLSGGPLDAISGEDRYNRTRIIRGLRDSRNAAFDQSESAQNASLRARGVSERARLTATAAGGELAAAEQAAALNGEAAAQERLTRAQAKFAVATRRAEVAADRATLAADEAAVAQDVAAAESARYEGLRNASNRDLRATRLHVSRNLAVPNAEGVEEVGPGAAVGPGATTTAAERAARDGAAVQREASTTAQRVEASLTQTYAGYRSGFTRLEESNISVRAAGKATDAVATRVISGAGHAAEGIERAAAGVRGVGAGFSGMLAAMGPLDIALIGFIGGELLTTAFNNMSKDLGEADKFFSDYTEGTRAAQVKLQQQVQKSSGSGGAGAYIGDHLSALNDFFNPVQLVTHTIPGYIKGTYESSGQKRKRLQEEADQSSETAYQRALVQGGEARANKPVTSLTVEQEVRRIKHDQEQRRQGIISQQEFDALMAKHAIEVKTLLDPTKEDLATARGAYASAQRAFGDPKSYADSLRGLDQKHLSSELQTNVTAFGRNDSSQNLSHLRAVYQEFGRRAGTDGGVKNLNDARNAYFQALTQRAQADQALQQSSTSDPVQQSVIAIRFAEQAVRRARRMYGLHSLEYEAAVTSLHNAEQQRDQAVLQGVQADNALLLAQAGTDPLAQAQASVQGAQRVLDTLNSQKAKGHKVDPNAIKNARAQVITQQNQAKQTQQQQDQQVAQIESQLAQAQAGDPVGAARIGVRAAQQALGKAHGRVETLQAQLDLVNAQNTLTQAIAASADATIQLQESLTTDPVKIAALEVQRAKVGLKGKKGTDKTLAQANLNKALQSQRDTSLQAKESEIDFEQQMGTISVQDAMDRYNALLKTRNLTKQQKQDIQLKVHQLQQQAQAEASGFDLDVGSIKMPTLYDVRKGFDPIRGIINQQRDLAKSAARGTIANRQTGVQQQVADLQTAGGVSGQNNTTVNVYVNDKNAAADVYAAIDRAMGTKVKATMRSRGHRR